MNTCLMDVTYIYVSRGLCASEGSVAAVTRSQSVSTSSSSTPLSKLIQSSKNYLVFFCLPTILFKLSFASPFGKLARL